MFYAKKSTVKDLVMLLKDNTREDVTDFYDDVLDMEIPANSGEENGNYNGIKFDLENIAKPDFMSMKNNDNAYFIRQIGDYAVAMFAGGGDWEYPVYFVVYIGEDNKIHAYTPTEGNTYNPITKTAFGSEDSSDHWDEFEKYAEKKGIDLEILCDAPPEECDDPAYIELLESQEYDFEKMFQNVEDNITVR